jgi:hypothetical protein
MEVEQRYVIKFFTDEGMLGIEIISRLSKQYGENALSRMQVYFWISEIKRGRTDLNTIAGKLDADPTSRRESSPNPWALRLQRSVAI